MGVYFWTDAEVKWVESIRRDQEEMRLYGARPPKQLTGVLRKLWVPSHEAYAHINPAFLSTSAGATGGVTKVTSGVINGGGKIYPGISVPQAGWPDPYMSYTLQPTELSYSGVNGLTISNLRFEGITRPNKPIRLENCTNVLVSRIDTRKCAMGLMYALNSSNLTIEYCRTENIGWEFRNAYLIPGSLDRQEYHYYFPNDAWPIFYNQNDCNFYQLDTCVTIRTSHMKGRYGNTEDYFSHYQCHDVVCDDLQVEGATATNRPTSDGAQSVMWTSASGTGAIAGDQGGYDITINNSSFLNAGQVGMQIAGGYNCIYNNCVSYNEGYSPQWWNQPAATWAGTPPMTGHGIINSRTWGVKDANIDVSPYPGTQNWVQTGGWWDVTPDLTGTVLQDATLNKEDYRVVL